MSDLTLLDTKLAKVQAAKEARKNKPKPKPKMKPVIIVNAPPPEPSPRVPVTPFAGKGFDRKIDRDELYLYLWKRADRRHRIRIHKSNLAAALGVSIHTVSVIIKKFCEEGKLLQVGIEKSNISVYSVTDPETYDPAAESTWTQGKEPVKKELKWG